MLTRLLHYASKYLSGYYNYDDTEVILNCTQTFTFNTCSHTFCYVTCRGVYRPTPYKRWSKCTMEKV